MKQLAIMSLLVLALTSCREPLRHETMVELASGKVVGKWTERRSGYFLELKQNDVVGYVRVDRRAWDKANVGMKWPFVTERRNILDTKNVFDIRLNRNKK